MAPVDWKRRGKEISLMLLSHATADLPVHEVAGITPVGPTTQRVLAKRVGFAPILRAGAGMIPAAHEVKKATAAGGGTSGGCSHERTVVRREYQHAASLRSRRVGSGAYPRLSGSGAPPSNPPSP